MSTRALSSRINRGACRIGVVGRHALYGFVGHVAGGGYEERVIVIRMMKVSTGATVHISRARSTPYAFRILAAETATIPAMMPNVVAAENLTNRPPR